VVRERLLQKDFKFKPLRPTFIPKSEGRVRIICVPTVEDRLIQRLVLRHLSNGDRFKINTPVSYGFRKGAGVQNAVQKARNLRRSHRWVLKSNIAAFFDKIQRENLKVEVLTRLQRSSLGPIICAAIDTEIQTPDRKEKERIQKAGIVSGLGLRQGMPLSPVLSNLVLREFDLKLYRVGISLVRYADDFVILADSENECLTALDLVRNLLARKGHSVPDLGPKSKTQIYSPDKAVEFLGFELRPNDGSYEIAVPCVAFDEVKQRLRQFESFDLVRDRWQHLSRAISALNSISDGFIGSYRPAKNFHDLRSHANRAGKMPSMVCSVLSLVRRRSAT
jgi:RNA-directed DNA polymerase